MKKNTTLANRYVFNEARMEPLESDPLISLGVGTDKLLKRAIEVRYLFTREPTEARCAEETFDTHLNRLTHLAGANAIDLVPICDVIRTSKVKNILVSEKCQLPTLRDVLQRQGFLQERHALAVAAHVVRAIFSLDERRTCHGAICPENIVFWSNGTIKLCYNVLFSNKVSYTAPESQKTSVRSTASDMFSLGVVLHEMLLGALPFKANEPSLLRDQMRQKLYNYDYRVREDVPFRILLSKEVRNLIYQLLSYQPEERPRPASLIGSMLLPKLDDFSRLQANDAIAKKLVQVSATKRTVRTELYTEEECLAVYLKQGCLATLRNVEMSFFDAELYELDTHKSKLAKFKASSAAPVCLRVYEMEGTGSCQVILTEYNNQHTLLDYLRAREQPCNESQANYYLTRVVERLSLLREDILDHCTLQPRSIVFNCGEVKVRQPTLLNRKLKGKLNEFAEGQFYSPEVREGNGAGRAVFKSDVWSLGVLYYQLLFQRYPELDSGKMLVLPDKYYLSLTAVDFLKKTLVYVPENRLQFGQLRIGSYQSSWDKADSFQHEDQIRNQPEQPVPAKSFNYRYYFGQEGCYQFLGVVNKNVRVPRLIVLSVMSFLLLTFLFFPNFLSGAGKTLQQYGYFSSATFATSRNSGKQAYSMTVLTQNSTYFLKTFSRQSYEYIRIHQHCMESPFDKNGPSLLSVVESAGMYLLAVLSLLLYLWLVASKILQVSKRDISRSFVLLRDKTDGAYNSMYALLLGQLNRSYLLFYHFYLFQFYYLVLYEPCLGLRPSGLTALDFDSYSFILKGDGASFAARVLTCAIIPFLYAVTVDCLLTFKTELLLATGPHFGYLFIPYPVLMLLSRVGFGPASILYPSFSNGVRREVFQSYPMVLGFVPEIMVGGLLLCELLVDAAFYLGIVCSRVQRQAPQEQSKLQLQNQFQLKELKFQQLQ